MIQFGTCSICFREFSNDKFYDQFAVCDCGHVHSFSEPHKTKKRRLGGSFEWTVALVALMLISGFIHLVQWDQHSLAVIPLKLKVGTGTADLEDYRKLTRICQERLKWSCVAQTLESRYHQDPVAEKESLGELGRLYYRLGDFRRSAQILKAYRGEGGKEANSLYAYAQSLGQIGQVDMAMLVYEELLKLRPEILQITVAQSYVHLLLENQRDRDAKVLLTKIRKLGENTRGFMDKEFRDLNQARSIASESKI